MKSCECHILVHYMNKTSVVSDVFYDQRWQCLTNNANWWILDNLPDLRGQQVTQNFQFGYQRLHLVTNNTLVFESEL